MTDHPEPEPFEPADAGETELRALYALTATEHAELWAEDPVQSFEQWRTELLAPPSWRKTRRWVVWNADRTAVDAAGRLVLEYTEANRNLADVDLYVHPDARGAGRARAVLRRIAEAASADGRTILTGGGPADSLATGFSEALGATRKSVERKSRMAVADVDRAMLEDWVTKADERAAGYSLLRWDGPVPEEYLDRFVQLTMVMNTAPRDDLEMEDWITTPERHRENEERSAKHGYRWWTVVVRHDDTDQLAGFTEFVFPPSDPHTAWQEATAVDPVHRDRGLGRLLKAANCLRLMDERPDIRTVDTWNAFSNAPMLGINIAMGFEVVNTSCAYQIGTEALLARLT